MGPIWPPYFVVHFTLLMFLLVLFTTRAASLFLLCDASPLLHVSLLYCPPKYLFAPCCFVAPPCFVVVQCLAIFNVSLLLCPYWYFPPYLSFLQCVGDLELFGGKLGNIQTNKKILLFFFFGFPSLICF